MSRFETRLFEKLTDAQKFALRNPLNTRSVRLAGAEAIRIIDQLTAALEAAEGRLKSRTAELLKATAGEVSAESRAEALQSRVAELEAARDALLRCSSRDRAEKAESELADLRMANRECQEVASRNAADATHLRQTAITLETELADLRGRVESEIISVLNGHTSGGKAPRGGRILPK